LFPYAGDTNIRVMFEAHSAGGGNDMALDSISFFQAVCPVAVNLNATATSNTITFTWADQQNETPTNYIVRYAKNVSDSTFWTTATVWYPNHSYTTPPILFQNTQYYWQVRTQCDSAGDNSAGYPIFYDSVATCIPLTFTGNPTNFNLCQGGNVVITAPTGFQTYAWSNGSSTQSNTVTTAGTYTVTVNAVPGCPNHASVTVTQTCGSPTSLSTTTITATSALTQFGNVTCADSFKIQWRVSGTTPWTNSITKINTGYNITGLTPNTSYDWQVQTICNGNILSSFANYLTFTTCPQVVITGSPVDRNLCYGGSVTLTATPTFNSYSWTGGATTQTLTVSSTGGYGVTATGTGGCKSNVATTVVQTCAAPTGLTASANLVTETLNWNAVECGQTYAIEYRKQGTTPWTIIGPISGTTATILNLLPSTTYNWGVRTYCGPGSDTSAYATGANFTSGLRMEAGISISSGLAFKVYPNPATDHATIVFSTDQEGAYTIKITDMMGRVVFEEADNAASGDNLKQINLEHIAKGVYSLELQMGESTNKVKLVLQ
jgi:hypothetical protein